MSTLDCLAKVTIFSALSPDALADVSHYVGHVHHQAGDIIYQNGQKAHNFYIVDSGRLRTYRLAENGKLQTLRYVKAGEFAGDLAYFRQLPAYEAYADAIVATDLCYIDYQDLDNLLLRYPVIQKAMLKALADRLSNLENLTLSITTTSAEERLLHYLTEMSVINAENKRVTKNNYSRKEAASYLGMSPETMSRLLTTLAKKNKLAIHRDYFEIL